MLKDGGRLVRDDILEMWEKELLKPLVFMPGHKTFRYEPASRAKPWPFGTVVRNRSAGGPGCLLVLSDTGGDGYGTDSFDAVALYETADMVLGTVLNGLYRPNWEPDI
jgi:hypothetical protein